MPWVTPDLEASKRATASMSAKWKIHGYSGTVPSAYKERKGPDLLSPRDIDSIPGYQGHKHGSMAVFAKSYNETLRLAEEESPLRPHSPRTASPRVANSHLFMVSAGVKGQFARTNARQAFADNQAIDTKMRQTREEISLRSKGILPAGDKTTSAAVIRRGHAEPSVGLQRQYSGTRRLFRAEPRRDRYERVQAEVAEHHTLSRESEAGELMRLVRAKMELRGRSLAEQMIRARLVFQSLDTIGSGRVNEGEFRHAMEVMNMSLTDEQTFALFSYRDPNCEGTIEWEPFVEALLASRKG